jgi:cytochrome c-type biogenesis protein CcmH
MRPAALLLVLLLLAAARPALAIEPGEALADPAEEARARAISREIRCLVCQNENIDESGADLARDLRRIVRERLAAGDSDQAVRDYLVARYGDFVLLRPPLKPKTYLLWFAPPAILLLAGLGLFIHYRRRRTADGPPPLDEAERQALARLLAAPPDGEAR